MMSPAFQIFGVGIYMYACVHVPRLKVNLPVEGQFYDFMA